MKKILLWIPFLFFCVQLNAQKRLSLEQSVFTRDLQPENYTQFQWLGNSSFAFSRNGMDLNFAYLEKNKLHLSPRVLSIAQINQNLDGNTAQLAFLPTMKFKNGFFFFENDFSVWKADTLGNLKKINDWDKEGQFSEVSPAFDAAYVKNFDIYVKTVSGKTVRVTQDGEKHVVYGQTVHRSEFGIHKGFFWSEDGSKLAFYRMDERPVKDYPLVNYTEKPAALEIVKYPMAGEKSHHVTVGVFDLKSEKTVFLKTGEPAEQYLTNITWSPDAKKIYIAVLNREQNHLKLKRFNAETGEEEKILFEEKHEKYVEPENGLFFVPNGGGNFVWQSERDGFNHLYLYDSEGKLLKQLTKGNELVTELVGFDEKGEKIFFRHIGKRAIERHYSSVEIKTGTVRPLTHEAGTHFVYFSPDGKYMIDSYSSVSVPRKINIKSISEKQVATVETLLTAKNPLEGYNIPSMEIGTLKSEDGNELFYRIFKPADFDPGKKYPVMIYVYGGPHAQMITDTWRGGADYFSQYVAQEGFIVFTLDNRGSADRGLAFEQATFRQLGQAEMRDQMLGVELLKSFEFTDKNRIAVYGWSFGGFMATNLKLSYPDVFKVAVAGGPVMDWRYYEIMYTERYMDTPQDNPEGFEMTSLLNKVESLSGRLLLIHGQKDDVVVPQHSYMFMQMCIEKGKLVDTFFYPTHPHNVRGKDRVHLNKMIFDYILRGL
jgi:dipeptidyl-peptidase-4